MRVRRGGSRASLRPRGLARFAIGFGVIAVLALGLSACGGGGDDSQTRVLEAGQVDIKLPPGFKVVGNKVVAPREQVSAPATTVPTGATPGSPSAAGTPPTTAKSSVPLDDSRDPTTDMLVAFGKFRDCLQSEGVKFIGAPDPSNPESPTNDPTYIKGLSTCAARSNIVQALQSAQAEQDTLTPAQIKERNKGYLKWRDCMVKRGWDIPKPTPDEKGRLFAFSASNSGPQIKAPPGKDLFTSKDIEQCAARVERATQGQG